MIKFPRGFLFGAATASYQIEGAHDADGKGESIWDEFCRRKGKIIDGEDGRIACNHYHLYKEDIALMKAMNMQAYRFSISWPRIFPTGQGRLNDKGLDFYKRLADELNKNHIKPFATLFHWDLPYTLQRDLGGWASRDLPMIFADYAGQVADALGDRIENWFTLNEPNIFASAGTLLGVHAPGRKNPWAWLKTVHHLLLGHGLATKAIRAVSSNAKVGLAMQVPAIWSDKEETAAFFNDVMNDLYLKPMLLGEYPELVQRKLRLFWPKVQEGDMEVIAQPMDFIGINHYTVIRAPHKWYIPIVKALPDGVHPPEREYEKDGVQYTSMGWEVFPEGFYQAISHVNKLAPELPIYISENGAAYTDQLVDGKVHDEKRLQYYQSYLAEVKRAIDDGVPVHGYFAWSFMDNFEWAEGYTKRFGLVHVDYNSQKRTIKDSGRWYADLIKSQ